METSVEVSAKSVEEAIETGLAQLGLTHEQADIEIVREGSRGLFGIGGDDALVRVTARMGARPATGDVAEVAKETLEELLRGMGVSARVQVEADDARGEDAFILNILGHDLGILIGRRGETLRDLEFLMRLLVQHRTKRYPKLTVDVESYRTRRERVLQELARRMSERVQTSKQPITLEAMPPNERRIVHVALSDHPTVTTQSIGEGEHRRVMILPKK